LALWGQCRRLRGCACFCFLIASWPPAHWKGLRAGDTVVAFGSLRKGSFGGMADVARLVRSSVGVGDLQCVRGAVEGASGPATFLSVPAARH
jgi:hypothetical protein